MLFFLLLSGVLQAVQLQFKQRSLNRLIYKPYKMSIKERYAGKRVLITGTTGFLGKVLLQKFLYSVSSVDKIYILIRGKQGSNLFERFKKEIVSSPCFDRLRSVHKGKFDQFMQNKVQPIQGDLLKERLGLSAQAENELIQKCSIVINCAASIDFNARLDYALDINVRGTLRVLELARKIKDLDVFTQVSTCYVNCDQSGLIKEEIYEREMQPQEQFRWLQQKQLKDLIAQTNAILGKFPNTYTYTKNLCQRMIKKNQGGVPVCIIRPAIINPSYSEPFPGWVDSLAAAAALFLFVGLGICKVMKGNHKKIGDVVPVDFVANNIIVATAFNFKQKILPIYHVGSSDRNPLTWGQIGTEIESFWNGSNSSSKISKARMRMTSTPWKLNLEKFRQKLPVEIYQRLSVVMGKNHQKNSQKMNKAIERGWETSKIFEFFTSNDWTYECKSYKKFYNLLTQQDRKEFLIDVADIDIKKFIRLNNYGIQKFILKEDAQSPNTKNSNLLKIHSQQGFLSDFKWAKNTNIPITSSTQIKTKILTSTRVLKAIQFQVNKRQDKNMNSQKLKSIVKGQAGRIIDSLIAEAKIPVLRSMAWTLHKVFKNLFQKVNINMQMLEQIRQIGEKNEMPIVLLPTHRSYLDFLIVSYVFLVYNLRLPKFVADQALLQAQILPYIFRSCGAFFFKKTDYKQSTLYHIIFDKYIELLLRQNNTIEFFIEAQRSRTGKILAPKFEILNIVLDSIFYGKIPDACLIPVTVNYQKVLQGDTFPGELLGQEMLAESLTRVIKALPRIRINHGQVYINICKPFYPKQMIDNIKIESGNMQVPQFRKKVQSAVGREIINQLTNGIVTMSTAIVSSALLMYRKGIQQEGLIKIVNEIVKYIVKKGHKVGGVNQNSSAAAVRNAINYLGGVITKSKKNIFELTISAGGEFQKILMLSYYRNTLTHVFLPEAFIGCAIVSFGEQLYSNEGIPLLRIHEQSVFLMSLLKQQYLAPTSLQNYSDFMRVITQMQENSVIELRSQKKVAICLSATKIIAFYCSLLKSQIECYWACLVYILTIAKNADKKYETSSLSKFYNTIQWFTQSLYDQKIIQDYEACSLQTIKNAFGRYQEAHFVKLIEGRKKKDSEVEVLVPIEQLQGFQSKIKFFKKTQYNFFISPTELARQSINEVRNLPKL